MADCLWIGKEEFRRRMKSDWNSKASMPRRLDSDNPIDAAFWSTQRQGTRPYART
jgi:hypothetical protein